VLGRAAIYASLGASVWLGGYIYGYMVGERERTDSDPEDRIRGVVKEELRGNARHLGGRCSARASHPHQDQRWLARYVAA
jgi:hypothetical protein